MTMMMIPRDWQQRLQRDFMLKLKTNYLLEAWTSTGKTIGSLLIVQKLLNIGTIDYVVVVVPSTGTKGQWCECAWNNFGIDLQQNYETDKKGKIGCAQGKNGVVVTYSQIAANPEAWNSIVSSRKTFVIFDEPHHKAEGRPWGESAKIAFNNANFRLLVSGTPFRTDEKEIPFVDYKEIKEGEHKGKFEPITDMSYTYVEALTDRICREVVFPKYDAEYLKWRDRATGDVLEHTFRDKLPDNLANNRLTTATTAHTGFLDAIINEACSKLSELRKRDPDAGGLLIARNMIEARAYAAILGKRISSSPVVVMSKDENGKADTAAGERLREFGKSKKPWIVAVHMVSEGIDIPRLRVIIFATNIVTFLYFCQALGRALRRNEEVKNGKLTNRIVGGDGPAYFYIVDDVRLVEFATEIKARCAAYYRSLEGDTDCLDENNGKDNGSLNGLDPSLYGIDPLVGKGIRSGLVYDGHVYDEQMRQTMEEYRHEFSSMFANASDEEILEFIRKTMGSTPVVNSDAPKIESSTNDNSPRPTYESKEREEKAIKNLAMTKSKSYVSKSMGGYEPNNPKKQAEFSKLLKKYLHELSYVDKHGKLRRNQPPVLLKHADMSTAKGRIVYTEEKIKHL